MFLRKSKKGFYLFRKVINGLVLRISLQKVFANLAEL